VPGTASRLRVEEVVGEDLGVGRGETEASELLQDFFAVAQASVLTESLRAAPEVFTVARDLLSCRTTKGE
jgi:hypothetical protein